MAKAWSQEERDRACRLRAENRASSYIARVLGREPDDVEIFFERERKRAEKAKRKVRLCLRCSCKFMSAGPHNRLCIPCRAAASSAPGFLHPQGDGCSVSSGSGY